MGTIKQIRELTVVRPGVARALFITGELREIEWRLFADEGPVFAKLKDPNYSDAFKLIHNGSGVEWPDGMDWSAGAVYKDSTPVLDGTIEFKTSARPARPSSRKQADSPVPAKFVTAVKHKKA